MREPRLRYTRFFKSAAVSLLASIAAIRRFQANSTGLLLKIRAKTIATTARLAIFNEFPSTISITSMVFRTIGSVNTGIVGSSTVTRFFDHSILLDLSGNSGTIFAKTFGDFLEGTIFSKTIFYFQSFFKSGIMGHDRLCSRSTAFVVKQCFCYSMILYH